MGVDLHADLHVGGKHVTRVTAVDSPRLSQGQARRARCAVHHELENSVVLGPH
jgi:hypothetical protein